jgi:hypothetical protein
MVLLGVLYFLGRPAKSQPKAKQSQNAACHAVSSGDQTGAEELQAILRRFEREAVR